MVVNSTSKYDEPDDAVECDISTEGLSFTFCDFDTVAFLIISTFVIHRMLRSSVRLTYSGASER